MAANPSADDRCPRQLLYEFRCWNEHLIVKQVGDLDVVGPTLHRAKMEQRKEAIMRRPLYVFDLPVDVLSSLARKEDTAEGPDRELFAQPHKGVHDGLKATTESTVGSKGCSLCGVNFQVVHEQKSHIRSDFHSYNLKQRMKGINPVSEIEFEKLVEELDESLSGSDTSESSEDESERKTSTLTALLKKQAAISASHDDEEISGSSKHTNGAGKVPVVWFSTPLLPQHTYLGIYRALFDPSELSPDCDTISVLRQKQLTPKASLKTSPNGAALSTTPKDPHFFLCMIGGGHFAAMVVSLIPSKTPHASASFMKDTTVIASKTFHRYTTRRKQGGSQSANDSAKGAAHSAGSSLRRYNEMALTEEVRGLLKEWKGWIDSAQMCFVRASGTSNRKTLFGPYEGQVLLQKDVRIRGYPFGTRRATKGELLRAFVELTRVKVITIDPTIAFKAQVPATPKSTKPTKAKEIPSEAEQTALLHTHQITTLIRRSKLPPLLTYFSTHSLPPDYMFSPSSTYHHTPTPLHLASSLSNCLIIKALLTLGADLSLRSADSRNPFDISDRRTKEWYRVFRHELSSSHPTIPWDEIGVGPPLPRPELEALESGEKEQAHKVEEQRRKDEVDRLNKIDSRPSDSPDGPPAAETTRGKRQEAGRQKVLGLMHGNTGLRSPEDTRQLEMRGLTDEMRRRVERERRARAAEARFGTKP